MANIEPILVTGAAGNFGAVGRTVVGLLLNRGIPVRAMVRRETAKAPSSDGTVLKLVRLTPVLTAKT